MLQLHVRFLVAASAVDSNTGAATASNIRKANALMISFRIILSPLL